MKNNRIAKLFIILILTIVVATPIYFSLAQQTENAADISFTANLYETSSYALEGEGTALTTAGTQINAWEYATSKYLQVNTKVPDDGKTYVVQVKTPQEFYIVSNNLTAPSGFSGVEFTKNEDLTVNGGAGTYKVNKYSGTANFTIDGGVEISTLQLQITYDAVLWDKLGNSLLTKEGVYPLEVILCVKEDDSSLTKIKELYVSKAYSGSAYSFGFSPNYYKPGTSNLTTQKVINSHYFRADSQINEWIYFEYFEMIIDLPYYTDNSGIKHYISYDASALTLASNMAYETDESIEGKLKIIIKNGLSYTEDYRITNLKFSFPESLSGNTDTTSYQFKGGGVTYYINNKLGEKKTLRSRADMTILTFNTRAEEKVATTVFHGYTTMYSLKSDKATRFLGGLSLKNTDGQGDSEAKELEYVFDTENSGFIHVSTINLPVDNITEYFDINYTLVDDNGEKVYLDENGNRVAEGVEGAISEWKYSLKNTKYGDKNNPSSAWCFKFHRGILPKEQQNYYLKTINYTLGVVKAGKSLDGSKYPNNAGSFWGYVKEGTTNNQKTYSTLTIKSTSGSYSELKQQCTTTIQSTYETAFSISEARINGKLQNSVSISAGDSISVSGQIECISYQYGNSFWLENMVLTLILPEGLTINEDSISLYTKSSSNTFLPEKVEKEIAANGNNIWKIYIPSNIAIGYASETGNKITEGAHVNFSLKLNSSYHMGQQTIALKDSLYVYSKTQTNIAGGSYAWARHLDTYDLNGDGKTDDGIGGIKETDTSSIEITPQSATFEVKDNLEIAHSNNTISSGTNLKLYSKDDIITYNLHLNCTGGGMVNNFEYFMPIPKVDFNSGGYLVSTTEKAFDMALLDKTSISGQDLYNIYYTLDKNLNYTSAGADTVTWYTAEDMTANDLSYSDVTIIRITPKEEIIENGSQTTLSIKLKYNGTDYIKEAGMTYTWASCGHYTYIINGRETTGNFPTDGVTATLTYEITEEKMDKITLTAAKNMTPLLGGNVREKATSIENVPLFKNSQTFRITNVETYNVNLKTKEYIQANTNMSGAEANGQFGITVKLNSGEEKDILSTASTNNITIGTVGAEKETQFTYKIYNLNTLSDASSTRYIKVTYETDNGVMLTQKINIQLELTEAQDPKSAIVAGNRYRIYDDTTTQISISQDSSFTTQFVSNYIPDVYTNKRLDFSSNMPVGTSIIILDKLKENTNYTYWYYKVEQETASISLSDFKKMGTDATNYTNAQGQEQLEEIFLVLVNFKNSTGLSKGPYSLKLVLSGENVEEVNSSELTFNIKNKRTFAVNTSSEKVKYGEDFTINYTMQASSGTETIYSGNKISLVLTPKTNIPEDTCITANGTNYYHNSNNQFIIPCSNVMGDDGNITVNINSDMLKHIGDEFEFDVELWVGATSNASSPLMGQKKASTTILVQDEQQSKASLKVTGITARLIDYNSLNNLQTISFEYRIDANCVATVELQQKIGSAYEIVTDKLNSVNGNTTHNKGVYALTLDSTATNGSADFKLSTQTTIGTYRLVFKIFNNNGEQILEVPYSFLVI